MGRREQIAKAYRLRLAKERVVWIRLDEWAVSEAIKERCVHGAQWLDGQCYAKDATTGVTVGCVAGGVTKLPPKADIETAAKRLLAEALAELHEKSTQSVTLMRDALIRQGQDPEAILEQARERDAAEQRRADKLDELGRRLDDVK